MVIAISTRSRTICSTSRPTYPTSVNLVASTFRNGAWASFADAGRADHQDVLGQHLFPEAFRQLEPAPAVAERNRDGALGIVLADDEPVQFRDDLAGAEGSHGLFFVRSASGAVHRYDTVIRGRFEPACHYIFSTMTL
jgi:hypothetical protein